MRHPLWQLGCREDVVDALSQFIAAYLTTLPEAQNLEPRQLQRAIATTLKVGGDC
jgi:hypothetical protein